MRYLLVFLLSLCLTFNAAYAAATDICDAAETGQSSTHVEHFGHHNHDNDHANDAGTKLPHGDHYHPHQCFVSILPGVLKLPMSLGRHIPPSGAIDRLFSAFRARLERPPRVRLLA